MPRFPEARIPNSMQDLMIYLIDCALAAYKSLISWHSSASRLKLSPFVSDQLRKVNPTYGDHMASDRIYAIISEGSLSDIPSSRLLACMKYKKGKKEEGTRHMYIKL